MRFSPCLLCVALAMALSSHTTASPTVEPTELVLDERVLMRHGAMPLPRR